MALPHLDCTTESRREEICHEYEVHADDCIVLYGGRTVRSDANNRIIRDKFYQFSCENRQTSAKYVITCGAGAARHFCSLINEPMPHAMDPFFHENPNNDVQRTNTAEHDSAAEWNEVRRQFYYSVQLFITRYQEILTPGTRIFKILHGISDQRYLKIPPRDFQYEQFADVVNAFHTNIPQVIAELGRHGRLHNYDLSGLARELHSLFPDKPNIFLET